MNKKYEDNQLELPTRVLLLDVEEQHISTQDRKRILSPDFRGVLLVLSDEDIKHDKDTGAIRGVKFARINVPIKILIGDSVNWLRVISMPVMQVDDKLIWHIPLPDCVPEKSTHSDGIWY